MKADEILDALIAASDDKIWASELALLSGGRRIDFWTLEPAASRGFRAQAYEIKVSRAPESKTPMGWLDKVMGE